MNKNELNEIKKLQKRPDGIFGSFMTRPVSHIVAYISNILKLTPNIVSFISLVLCLITCSILFFNQMHCSFIVAAILWWFAAIFDAADGDLARYIGKSSTFGGWLDSLFDRMKELLIFGVLGYVAYKNYNNELYLLLGFLSIFTNVMSGWISDTKKLLIEKRDVEIKLSKKYCLGMVDTRDFIIIVSLLLHEIRLALFLYSTLFLLVLLYQIILFYKRYAPR